MSWLDDFFSKGYLTVQSGGVNLPNESILNFQSGCSVVDDPTNGRTTVNITVLSTPSGTGWVHITSGGVDTVARAVNIASSDITGLLDPNTNLAFGATCQVMVTNSPGTFAEWKTVTQDIEIGPSDAGVWTVVGIQGVPVNATPPTGGQFVISTSGGSEWEAASLSGDVSNSTGTPGLLTVVGIQTVDVASTTPVLSNILGFNGTEWTPTNNLPETYNQTQAALLQWYKGQSIAVNSGPQSVCFDGYNVWVVNEGSNTVSVIQVSSGTVTQTINLPFTSGNTGYGCCYDGSHIWVTSPGSGGTNNQLCKINATTGGIVGTYTVGFGPTGLCYDGAGHVWVCNTHNATGTTVTKVNITNGSTIGTYTVGTNPTQCCSDGTNVWVTNGVTDNVTKLLASTGATVTTVSVTGSPQGICYDGYNIWVATGSDIIQILASAGTVTNTFAISGAFIAYDGAHLWVTDVNGSGTTIGKVTLTGTLLATYPFAGTTLTGLCWDTQNIWVGDGVSHVIRI